MFDVGELNVFYTDPEMEEVKQAINLLIKKEVFAQDTGANYFHKWLNSLDDTRLSGIRLEIRLAEIQTELDELLASNVNLQKRRQRGVELHGRLDKLSQQLGDMAPQPKLYVQQKIAHMATTILCEFFGIDPKPTVLPR